MEYIDYICEFMVFFLNFIEKISWQLVCLIIFFSLKKPIKNIILKIKSISYENGKYSVLLSETAENLGIEPCKNDNDYILCETNKDLYPFIVEEWNKINNIAAEKLKSLTNKEYERPLEYLKYTGCFSPKINSAIDILQTIRNDTTHNKIKLEDVRKYKVIANKIIENINAIQNLPLVNLFYFTQVMLVLIALIDSGEHNNITIEEVEEHIENENILQFIIGLDSYGLLGELAKGHKNFEKYYNKYLKMLYNGYSGKKWGIENSGLCLLATWTNEIIQGGSGWYPDQKFIKL